MMADSFESVQFSVWIDSQYIVAQYIDIRYIEQMGKSNARNQGTFLILLALLDSPKHGYEVAKFIEAKSNGFFRMPFGTLYPALHRLEKMGLIYGALDSSDAERDKKIYKLTSAGKKQAQSEVSEFQLFSQAVHRLVPN